MKPDQPNKDQPINKPEQKPMRKVETKDQFFDRLHDAQNQFLRIRWDFEKALPIEELIKKNRSYSHLLFKEYINKQNYELSSEIENNENYQHLVGVHDDLIKRIKKFKTIKELGQILEEVEEFLQR